MSLHYLTNNHKHIGVVVTLRIWQIVAAKIRRSRWPSLVWCCITVARHMSDTMHCAVKLSCPKLSASASFTWVRSVGWSLCSYDLSWKGLSSSQKWHCILVHATWQQLCLLVVADVPSFGYQFGCDVVLGGCYVVMMLYCLLTVLSLLVKAWYIIYVY